LTTKTQAETNTNTNAHTSIATEQQFPISSIVDGDGHDDNDNDKQIVAKEAPILLPQVSQDDTFHIKLDTGAIYRHGSSDVHECIHCRQRGDIHYMKGHECTGKK
jgi:hypothetical protein